MILGSSSPPTKDFRPDVKVAVPRRSSAADGAAALADTVLTQLAGAGRQLAKRPRSQGSREPWSEETDASKSQKNSAASRQTIHVKQQEPESQNRNVFQSETTLDIASSPRNHGQAVQPQQRFYGFVTLVKPGPRREDA
jgi:hypothetical protein